MTRRHDRLIDFIESRASMPFAWGRRGNDCVSFAGQAVQALTGDDVLARLDADWTTALGATRVLTRLGGLESATDRMLSPIPPAKAQRGDVALVDHRTLMIVEGETLVGPGPKGLSRVPRATMIKAWSAGG